MQALNTEEQDRRQDEHLRFLKMVREWADGADVRVPRPAAAVEKLVGTFGHLSRQAGDLTITRSGLVRDRWYYAGKADTWKEAAELLKAALA